MGFRVCPAELLTPEEYTAARGSTLNAHYTSPTVIQAIYETVGRMGFETGNILEPSCGVGKFLRYAAGRMRCGSRLYGVELIPSVDGLQSSSTPRPTSPWPGLRPPTGVISMTLLSAMCRLASIRFEIKPMTS